MKKHSFLKQMIAALSLFGGTMLVYLLWARPAQLRWGAWRQG